MTYATIIDLERRMRGELVQIADLDDDGVADADVVAQVLADADHEIDAFLSTRYRLPLVPVPQMVTLWAVNIARYRLWSLKDDMPELVRSNYLDTVKQLQMAQRGDIVLETGAVAEPAERNPNTVRGTSAPRVFTGDSLRDFR